MHTFMASWPRGRRLCSGRKERNERRGRSELLPLFSSI
jgi:hypothetical protein